MTNDAKFLWLANLPDRTIQRTPYAEETLMATHGYNDVLKAAQELTLQEQQKLIEELARTATGNGSGGKHETLGEYFRKQGLVGIVKDGPADLSTNPKYMEGFGEDGDQ